MPEDFRRGQAARVGVSATMHHGRLCQSCEVVATLWMRVSAGNCSKRFHRLLSCLRIVLRTFSLTHSRNYKQKLLRLSRERERERKTSTATIWAARCCKPAPVQSRFSKSRFPINRPTLSLGNSQVMVYSASKAPGAVAFFTLPFEDFKAMSGSRK